MTQVTEGMAQRLEAMLPVADVGADCFPQVALETKSNSLWVSDGKRGFFVTARAMLEYPEDRLKAEVLSAWDALVNGADKDEHGVGIITMEELSKLDHALIVKAPQ